ncbi:MAG: ATP-binding protein [Desulfosalsimonadaceae bacterium]
MRTMRFRTRLLLSFWIILIPGLCAPAWYIFQTLKTDIIHEATANAFTELNFVGWLLEKNPEFENSLTLDKWCKELGTQLNYRITVIAAGGRVLADSEVEGRMIPELDNHADREEIIGARKLGQASSIRYSETLGKNLIYAAKNINYPISPSGVLRVAIPLSGVEARLESFSHQFWGILLAIFASTTILSLILAQKLEAPIRKIIQAATDIGEGDYSRRLEFEIETGTEFSPLVRCINDMAGKIGQNIDMITAQKQELEAVLEGMQEGVMLLDRDGKIKAVNQALTGIARCLPSCVGRRPMEVFLDAEIQAACDQILSEKEHMRLKAAMRNDRVYEVNLVKIPEDGAVVVFHDISELVRLEKVRQDFVANVSHELRTPLTSIKGYAETLQNPSFRAGDQAGEFVNIIVKNADQMSRVVADLLELTKLQQKSPQPEKPAVFNAAACFRSALDTCMPMLGEKHIRIMNLLATSITVQGDEHSLVQVFRNLLDNAIRHSPDGSCITVSSKDTNDMVVFAVEDEGTGIPRQHLKRIFERFYRVDKERSRASGGTGLGLAICRNAVQKMGGDIWAQSPPENRAKGSVFYFSLKKKI